MKKPLLLTPLIFLILLIPVHAQLEAGKLMVGVASTFNRYIGNSDLMNLSFTHYQSKFQGVTSGETKNFDLNLIPRAGYFIIDNLAAGLDLYISHSSTKNQLSESHHTMSQLCAVPFVRYYYPLQWSYPFVELNGGFGTLMEKNEEDEGSSGNFEKTYSVITFSGGIGIAKSIGNRATFDIMAGYSRLKVKGESDQGNTYGSFIVKMGFMVFFFQQQDLN